MKSIILFAICALVVTANVAFADDRVPQHQTEPNESQLAEHKHYTNKNGKTVHAPAHLKSGEVPDGASAKCGDGTYSFSQSHRGTCSRHGGVGQWY
jgi:hypothetical protein